MIAEALLLALVQAPAGPAPVEPQNRVTVSRAMADIIVNAAIKDAIARDAAVAIVVLDENGDVVQSLRMDGVRPQFLEIARRKAWTSAFTQQPSATVRDDVLAGQDLILSVEGIVPFRGGLPIVHEGRILGGIGVSGAQSEIDEAIGRAALQALEERLSD